MRSAGVMERAEKRESGGTVHVRMMYLAARAVSHRNGGVLVEKSAEQDYPEGHTVGMCLRWPGRGTSSEKAFYCCAGGFQRQYQGAEGWMR